MANYNVKGYIKDSNYYYFKDATARSSISTVEGKIGDLSTTQVSGDTVAAQISALNGNITTLDGKIPTTLASLTADSTHRLVTDTQINTWNNKVDKITGKGLSTNDFTSALLTKLNGIAAGAEVNVQSDWNVTDESADDFIKNKPEIPTPGHLYLYTVELYHLNYHFYIKIDIFTPIKYPLPYTTTNRRDKNAILNFIKAYYPTINISDSDSEHEYSFNSTNEIDSILLPTFTSLKKFEYIAINTYSTNPHFSIFYRKENDIDHIYSRELDKLFEYESPSYYITLVHQFL